MAQLYNDLLKQIAIKTDNITLCNLSLVSKNVKSLLYGEINRRKANIKSTKRLIERLFDHMKTSENACGVSRSNIDKEYYIKRGDVKYEYFVFNLRESCYAIGMRFEREELNEFLFNILIHDDVIVKKYSPQ